MWAGKTLSVIDITLRIYKGEGAWGFWRGKLYDFSTKYAHLLDYDCSFKELITLKISVSKLLHEYYYLARLHRQQNNHTPHQTDNTPTKDIHCVEPQHKSK